MSGRTRRGTTYWFQIGKGVPQGCVLSPCLCNLYAEYIMQNARLDEGQTGIKISGRNINNLRYADELTLSEEKLKRKSIQYCKVINLQLIKKKKERKKESERGE